MAMGLLSSENLENLDYSYSANISAYSYKRYYY